MIFTSFNRKKVLWDYFTFIMVVLKITISFLIIYHNIITIHSPFLLVFLKESLYTRIYFIC